MKRETWIILGLLALWYFSRHSASAGAAFQGPCPEGQIATAAGCFEPPYTV